MADNVTFQTTVATPPSGLVVRTDDVAGVQYQVIKIDVGGDGASLPLSNSNPLPISDAGGSITVDGTVTATLSGTTFAGQTAQTADYDSGAGTVNLAMIGMALPGAGGPVAGGTFTNPLRVDPTGTTAQPVTDNGGSLTVDGSVSIAAAIPAGNNNIGDVDVASIAAGNNLIGQVKVSDGTTVATVSDYINSKPLNVRLSDTNGDYVSAGGGTQYTEDAASAADPIGNALILRRRDTLSGTEVSADGDNIGAQATSKGELYVKHVDAIPITDNSGSITVDGTVTANAGTGPFPVSDNAGSLTVDAPVGTPVFVRLSDGAAAITTLAVDTELPAAAALSENFSNPTAPAVGAFNMNWDGSNWDRQPGNSTEGTLVYTKRSLTASAPTNVTVAATTGSAIAPNANRKGLIIRNTSTSGQRVSLHLAAGSAVLNDGVTLDVGDVFEMAEYDFTTAAISAIASAASARLSVQEFS